MAVVESVAFPWKDHSSMTRVVGLALVVELPELRRKQLPVACHAWLPCCSQASVPLDVGRSNKENCWTAYWRSKKESAGVIEIAEEDETFVVFRDRP